MVPTMSGWYHAVRRFFVDDESRWPHLSFRSLGTALGCELLTTLMDSSQVCCDFCVLGTTVSFLTTLWLWSSRTGSPCETRACIAKFVKGNECTLGHLVWFMIKLVYFLFKRISNQDWLRRAHKSWLSPRAYKIQVRTTQAVWADTGRSKSVHTA